MLPREQMSSREPKRNTTPPRPRSRTTRRGIAPMMDPDAEQTQFGAPPIDDEHHAEPALSARPTRRDIVAPDVETTSTRSGPRGRGPRGEFSIPSARGIATDVVSGSIERKTGQMTPPRRRRTSMNAIETVHLATATKRDITVIIRGQTLTLARQDALALAQIILTAFE